MTKYFVKKKKILNREKQIYFEFNENKNKNSSFFFLHIYSIFSDGELSADIDCIMA